MQGDSFCDSQTASQNGSTICKVILHVMVPFISITDSQDNSDIVYGNFRSILEYEYI